MVPVSELRVVDIPYLRSFVLDAWRLAGSSALGWTGATDENIAEIASESFLKGLIGNSDLRVFIGKQGECIVGFCAIRKVDYQSVELAGIIVRQDLLGKGIGNDLFRRAREEAVELGFKVMVVKTESTNERALSFYESKGFVKQGQIVEELSGAKMNLTVLHLNLPKK
jgi:ribosomal protein S18 acetylase RimI-like enzyme